MKLTDVMKVWEKIHIMNLGELGFCDLDKAIDEVVGVENDICGCQPVNETNQKEA